MAEILTWKVKVQAEITVQADSQDEAKSVAQAYLQANPSKLSWGYELMTVYVPDEP